MTPLPAVMSLSLNESGLSSYPVNDKFTWRTRIPSARYCSQSDQPDSHSLLKPLEPFGKTSLSLSIWVLPVCFQYKMVLTVISCQQKSTGTPVPSHRLSLRNMILSNLPLGVLLWAHRNRSKKFRLVTSFTALIGQSLWMGGSRPASSH